MSGRGDEQLWPMLDGAVIGGMGGVVNYFKNKTAIDWGRLFVAVLTAAFAGMLAQLTADWLDAGVKAQFAMAGIAGYSGVTLLDDVAARVRRLVNGGLDALEKSLESKADKD